MAKASAASDDTKFEGIGTQVGALDRFGKAEKRCMIPLVSSPVAERASSKAVARSEQLSILLARNLARLQGLEYGQDALHLDTGESHELAALFT